MPRLSRLTSSPTAERSGYVAAGFDREHPLIEELKRKDFIAVADLTEDDVVASGFLDRFVDLCDEAGGFMRFLCDSARVPY